MAKEENKMANCTHFPKFKKRIEYRELIMHYKIMARNPSHIKYNFKNYQQWPIRLRRTMKCCNPVRNDRIFVAIRIFVYDCYDKTRSIYKIGKIRSCLK